MSDLEQTALALQSQVDALNQQMRDLREKEEVLLKEAQTAMLDHFFIDLKMAGTVWEWARDNELTARASDAGFADFDKVRHNYHDSFLLRDVRLSFEDSTIRIRAIPQNNPIYGGFDEIIGLAKKYQLKIKTGHLDKQAKEAQKVIDKHKKMKDFLTENGLLA